MNVNLTWGRSHGLITEEELSWPFQPSVAFLVHFFPVLRGLSLSKRGHERLYNRFKTAHLYLPIGVGVKTQHTASKHLTGHIMELIKYMLGIAPTKFAKSITEKITSYSKKDNLLFSGHVAFYVESLTVLYNPQLRFSCVQYCREDVKLKELERKWISKHIRKILDHEERQNEKRIRRIVIEKLGAGHD